MSATVVEIADLVVEDLNQSSVQDELSGDFSFDAVRSYLPEKTLVDVSKQLYCFVVPRSAQSRFVSRSSSFKVAVVEIGFAIHPPSTLTDQWMDGLVGLVESVGDRMLGIYYTLDDGYRATCMETSTPIAYDYEALRTANEFRSFVMCTFRMENT